MLALSIVLSSIIEASTVQSAPCVFCQTRGVHRGSQSAKLLYWKFFFFRKESFCNRTTNTLFGKRPFLEAFPFQRIACMHTIYSLYYRNSQGVGLHNAQHTTHVHLRNAELTPTSSVPLKPLNPSVVLPPLPLPQNSRAWPPLIIPRNWRHQNLLLPLSLHLWKRNPIWLFDWEN